MILVIILLLGISTGQSYAISLFFGGNAQSRDGYNEYDTKKIALDICLFSSEIEDVSEESSDEDAESNEEFSIIDSTFSECFTQVFKSDDNLETRPSSFFYTKPSRFIFFRNLRI